MLLSRSLVLSLVLPAQSRLKPMEHNFTGPSSTLGIEEERMILDDETYNSRCEAMVHSFSERRAPGERLAAYPWQMLDDNKWLAARHGLDGELVDLPSSDRVMAEIVEATGA